MANQNLKKVVESYMEKVPEVREYCNRCLRTERWNGSVVLMIVDASFTSLGLNYFQAVVPKVEEFKRRFIDKGKIKTVEDLVTGDIANLRAVWKNRRSWEVAKRIASYLAEIKKEIKSDDREAFIYWAKNTKLENWEEDPVGKIKGVGINTFQYLRMMAGIDTVMPDKIVKRVIGEMFKQAGLTMPSNDIDFIKEVEHVAMETGYRAIELCWMTWLIQSEAGSIRIEKYAHLLPKI
ncbi:MAG: hypothetical protein QMD22_03830 [archaeon]|nr:hypothetical protein [archaeon]